MTHPVRASDLALLFFLGVAWGSSFMLIKLGVATIPPLTLAAARIVGAAIILAIIARIQGHTLSRLGGAWSLLLFIGLAGNAAPFALIAWGETHIDSALAAILMATVPLFTVVLAHFFSESDRFSINKVIGLVLGFSGVLILVGPDAVARAGGDVLGALAVIGATLSYALTNIAAHRLRNIPPMLSGAGALGCAALWAVPLSLVMDKPWTIMPSGESLLALLVLTLISTALGNLVFFLLVSRTGPSFVAFNNYLIPGMGVIFGVLFLGEQIGLPTILALLLILSGIAAVTWRNGFAKFSLRKRNNSPGG